MVYHDHNLVLERMLEDLPMIQYYTVLLRSRMVVEGMNSVEDVYDDWWDHLIFVLVDCDLHDGSDYDHGIV